MLGNADLYRMTVEWLVERQVLPVELHRPSAPKMQSYIHMTNVQDGMFFWLLVVAEPLLVLLMGIGVSVVRRIRH
jgi:hypothetical protein